MLENFIITNHAISRYAERIGYNKNDIIKRIKSDLYFTKTIRIVNHEDTRYIFTYNSKEFIFKKSNGLWILKTVIKRNRERHYEAIEKRKTIYI